MKKRGNSKPIYQTILGFESLPPPQYVPSLAKMDCDFSVEGSEADEIELTAAVLLSAATGTTDGPILLSAAGWKEAVGALGLSV